MSIHRTKYGTWDVRWRDIDGRQRSRSFRTRSLAEKHEREVRTDTARGIPTAPPKRLTVAAWAAQWLGGAHNLAPRTRAMYGDALSHLLPELGKYPLHRLSATHIDKALTAYAATGAAASSVDRAYRTLRTMINDAVKRDLILKSPMGSVRRPKVPRQEMRFMSADELERLAASIDPRYRSLVLVAGWGGLRWGELAGLRVGDVDHEGGRVNVTGQLSTDGRRWKPETKTSGRRSVDLPASVMRELPRNDRATSHDDAQVRGYVWTMPAGGPLEHSKFRQRFFVPAVVKAGLGTVENGHYKGLRIHDLRHTSVALAIAAGAHPAEIQAQLGHTSIKTTLDEYGHRFPSQAREVADRLETVRSAARRLRAV